MMNLSIWFSDSDSRSDDSNVFEKGGDRNDVTIVENNADNFGSAY